jgi:hypothetical protein
MIFSHHLLPNVITIFSTNTNNLIETALLNTLRFVKSIHVHHVRISVNFFTLTFSMYDETLYLPRVVIEAGE